MDDAIGRNASLVMDAYVLNGSFNGMLVPSGGRVDMAGPDGGWPVAQGPAWFTSTCIGEIPGVVGGWAANVQCADIPAVAFVDLSAETFGKYQYCTQNRADGLFYADSDFADGRGGGGLRPGALPSPRQSTHAATERAKAMHEASAALATSAVLAKAAAPRPVAVPAHEAAAWRLPMAVYAPLILPAACALALYAWIVARAIG